MSKIKQLIMLDVGCGFNCQAGFVGMDKRDVSGVQIVHDAEDIPWPLENESCSVITMIHLIEHIKPWRQIDVINECWRVLEMNGVLVLATPYGMSFRYFQDPTHCSPWVEATPEYFIKGKSLYEVYRPLPWKEEKIYWDIKGDIEIALRKIPQEDDGNIDSEERK